MRSIYAGQSSPTKYDIPVTRIDYQCWSDVKKGIRDKVYSKVQGFENQKFIQKSDLLYNFKSDKHLPQSNQLRASTTYVRNVMDNVFPRQESPIRMGLTHSIYQSPQELELRTSPPLLAQYQDSKKKETFSQRRQSDLGNHTKTRQLNERVSLTEIIRISNHLQDVSQNEIQSLSSGYLQELVGLQHNINRILKNSSQKLYK